MRNGRSSPACKFSPRREARPFGRLCRAFGMARMAVVKSNPGAIGEGEIPAAAFTLSASRMIRLQRASGSRPKSGQTGGPLKPRADMVPLRSPNRTAQHRLGGADPGGGERAPLDPHFASRGGLAAPRSQVRGRFWQAREIRTRENQYQPISAQPSNIDTLGASSFHASHKVLSIRNAYYEFCICEGIIPLEYLI